MRSQGELEQIPQEAVKHISDLEIRIMEDIVGRIRENGFSSASSDWQITRLQQLGESETRIKDMIRQALGNIDTDIDHIFSDTVYEEYYGHKRSYELFGREQIPFEENMQLQELIEGIRQQTKDSFRNITGSIGFAIKDPATGKIMYSPLMDFYRDTLDNAMWDILLGAFDFHTALSRAVNQMTNSGVRYIDYNSGKRFRVDVAARMAIMTGFRQVQGKINEQVAEELGADQYEVSAHTGARPTHQPWQGRVYTMQQLIDVCGLGRADGLLGVNCYHDYDAFPPGSIRNYTDEQLADMIREENTPREYNGKQYTTYEALQRQRYMERKMRKTRQDIRLLQRGGASDQDIMLKKARYQGQMQTYKDFSEKMHLPEQWSRVHQDGLSGKFTPTKEELRTVQKSVAKASGSGIIESETTKEGIQVHSVGKIDKDIYKCITEDIVTDEVIITDERIRHIIDRRGKEFYEKYGDKFISILQDPDFIFQDKKNTALVCKEFAVDDKYINIALRLVVSTDNPEYKNSIITAVGESTKRFRQRLRNNEPLYKKE